jgi:hypothetical protein
MKEEKMNLKSVPNTFVIQSELKPSQSAYFRSDESIENITDYIDYVTKSPLLGLMELNSNIQTLSALQKKLTFLRGEVQEIMTYKKS